ncbi:MAG TPA: flagellar biosynthesis anti-sigma factor FlgM [Caldilineae bacterium]|nr:flagellar biosynthesis anti-sigma factor FlgM [Caldilineae bacterium]
MREARQVAQPQQDEVTISAEVHILQKAKAAAMAAPEVRADRVAELKRMISEGTYRVPIESLAERLLKGGLIGENPE